MDSFTGGPKGNVNPFDAGAGYGVTLGGWSVDKQWGINGTTTTSNTMAAGPASVTVTTAEDGTITVSSNLSTAAYDLVGGGITVGTFGDLKYSVQPEVGLGMGLFDLDANVHVNAYVTVDGVALVNGVIGVGNYISWTWDQAMKQMIELDPSQKYKSTYTPWDYYDYQSAGASKNWDGPTVGSGNLNDGYDNDHTGEPPDGYDGTSGGDSHTMDKDGVTTPVVIDLSLSTDATNASSQAGDGLNFLGMHNSPVFYNSDDDPFKERTAWVGPNEGIVIFTETDGKDRDLNHDGEITAKEVALTNVVNGATTDMEALYLGFDKGAAGSTDIAGDHKITSGEADKWGLRIWQDANMNGKLDDGELKSWADAGVKVIDLNDTNVDNLADEGTGTKPNQVIASRFSDGSVIFGTAKVTLYNGKETTAYDMGFAHESAGIWEHKTAGFVDYVTLEKPDGASGAWNYLTATGSTGVDWDFDNSAKSDYYGGTGTAAGDYMHYTGSLSRSFAGGGGWDTLAGGAGDDYLVGGTGTDKLTGGAGNDVLYIDAADTAGAGAILGGDGFDVLKVNTADAVTINLANAEAEAFYGSDGNDVVTAGANRQISVILAGGGGNDDLTGGTDDDILIGEDGNDHLAGGEGSDQLIGGKGSDWLYGNEGDDYIVAGENADFGHVNGGAGFDILVIDDSINSNIKFSTQLDIAAMGFEAAVGGDGNDVFNTGAITDNTFLIGLGGNDRLTTGLGDDLLSGGAGNDTLDGRNGNDIYAFNRDDGQDVISESVAADNPGGYDTISFGAKIDVDDLQFDVVGNDLVISLRKEWADDLSGEKITIKDNLVNGGNTRIESLAFADGTVLDIATNRFTTLGGASNSNGSATSGSGTMDNVGASIGLDVIDAGAGDDTIQAWGGNDIVLGRTGNDVLHGNNGYDYLEGGDGNDILYGEEDDDTLMGGRGAGSDRLYGGVGNDYLDGGNGADTLSGGVGADQLYGGNGDDVLTADDGDDILYGDKGNDAIDGGLGDDRYFIGRNEGVDTINDAGSDDDGATNTAGKGDHIAFGFDISITDLAFDYNSDTGNLTIGISRDGLVPGSVDNIANRVTIKNWNLASHRIEYLNFFDGSALATQNIDSASSGNNNFNSLTGDDKANLLTGGDGADTMKGNGGGDVILGGDGFDTIQGNDGNDNLFGGDGNDELRGGDGLDRLFGGAGNDVIIGYGDNDDDKQANADDFIVGGTGDDSLRGGTGNDTYFFSFGDGNDTIQEITKSWTFDLTTDEREYNTVEFGSGIWFSDIKVTKTSDSKLKMELLPLNRPTDDPTTITMNKWAIRTLEFSNGYFAHFGDIGDGRWGTAGDDTYKASTFVSSPYDGVWLNGNDGNDFLEGGGARDVLIGGQQNDTLRGGAGSDYYVFNYGDGHDTINETTGERGDSDSLAFGPGITMFDITMKSVGTSMVISLRDNDRQDLNPESADNNITVVNWNVDNRDHRIEWADFTVGNSLNIGKIGHAEVLADGNDTYTSSGNSNEWIDGGTGADTINTGAGEDIIFGRDGYDNLNGGDDDDQIYGEVGNDGIIGGSGNDQLFGGTGDDNITGGWGADWIYGGDGDDTLTSGGNSNLLNGGAGNDVIHRGGYEHHDPVTTTTGQYYVWGHEENTGGITTTVTDPGVKNGYVRLTDINSAVTVILMSVFKGLGIGFSRRLFSVEEGLLCCLLQDAAALRRRLIRL